MAHALAEAPLAPQALLDDESRALGPAAYPATPSGVSGPRWYVRPIDAPDATLRTLPLERGASRDLVRTNPIAAGAIGTNVDRVVGTGLALVAQPDRRVLGWSEDQAAEWAATVQREFSLWADSPDCDLRGEQNLYDAQRLVLRASLESGDTFTLLPDADKPRWGMPYKLRVQTIEADRVGNPFGQPDSAETAGGVRRDPATGEAIAYHVYRRHPGASLYPTAGSLYEGDWIDRVGPSGRRRMLHHFRVLRPEQPRGIPYLSPIVGHLQQLARYTDAEIKAAVVTAMLTVFVESDAGPSAAPVFGADAQGANAQGTAPPEIALGPGAVVGLAPGEKVSTVNPLRPNDQFEPFILAILKQIGMGLGMPFEVLLKVFNSSYSASKAALLDAWMRFRSERIWLARSFCQPVYETLLTEAVILGRVKAPGYFSDPLTRWAYSQAGWFGDSMGSINPKDEIAAFVDAIEARLVTRERAEWELFGTDWNQSFDKKAAEQKRLADADLLPVPKAGAPAPPPAAAGPSADAPRAEAPAPQPIAVHVAPPNVTVQPAAVTIHQGDTTIHLPESQINVEAVIEQPDVQVAAPTVHVDIPPAQVSVQTVAQPMRQVITRDADGEISAIETHPVTPPLQ